MKTEQRIWTKEKGWDIVSNNNLKDSAQLVFLFGDSSLLKDPQYFHQVKEFYPNAHIISGSTAGEIVGTRVLDNSLVVTGINFANTPLQCEKTTIQKTEDSLLAGETLANKLPKEGLVHVMIFSDGLHINGTNLVKGLTGKLPKEVAVTGGLVGDQARFKETYVGLDDVPEQNTVVVAGFYGSHIKIGYGSMGGWDPFGPE